MVSTREITEEYRLTHWAQVLRERAQSGLSIKAYCEQLGICGNTYFYWQRRVRAAAAAELELGVCAAQKQPHISFREVTAVERTAYPAVRSANAPGQLRIDVGGVRLAADSTYPVERLAQLLQTLSRLC